MMTKCIVFIALAVISCTQAGVLPVSVPAAAAVVAPYASSYNAHHINHAIATPVAAAAPLVAAAHAPYFAAPAYAASAYAAPAYAASAYAAPAYAAHAVAAPAFSAPGFLW